MIKKSFRITSETGIHARPATPLVNVAMVFESNIILTALRKTVDFKSIMGVMALGIYAGTTIEIKCVGKDEIEAMDAITDALVKQGLGKEL
jgi:phosphocarrier protein